MVSVVLYLNSISIFEPALIGISELAITSTATVFTIKQGMLCGSTIPAIPEAVRTLVPITPVASAAD